MIASMVVVACRYRTLVLTSVATLGWMPEPAWAARLVLTVQPPADAAPAEDTSEPDGWDSVAPSAASSPVAEPPPEEAATPPVQSPRKRRRLRGPIMMGVGGGLLGAGWLFSSVIGGIAAGLGREDGLFMLVPIAGPIIWFTRLGIDHPDLAVVYAIPAVLLGGLQIAGLGVLIAGGVIHARDRQAASLSFQLGRPYWSRSGRTFRQLSLMPGNVRLSF